MDRLTKITAACIAVFAVIVWNDRLGTVEGSGRGRPTRVRCRPGISRAGRTCRPYNPVANWPKPARRKPSRPSGVDMVTVHRHFS